MESGFLLDVVVRESASIFQLFPSEDESLLVRRDTFFVLDFSFHVFNGIGWFHIKSNGLASQGLDKDLHATT